MPKVTIDRELLEHMRNFTVMHDSGVAGVLRGQIDAILANPAQQGEAVEVVEVRGLQWLDSGHYRKKPPQFGYNPHDWNPLMTVAQHQRILEGVRQQRDALHAEAEALRTELAQAHGRADYWKQRAKSAEGHLWSSDAYAGARALQRYTRFEGTPWDELTGQQQAIIAAGACAVIAEVNARREIRKPTDAALEAENARLRAELEQSRDLIVEMSKHCNATALVADWLERNT